MFPEIACASPNTVREIGSAELAARLHSDARPQVAEILGPQSFASGHLPHAINLPLEGFAEAAPRALPDKAAEIVVYCASVTCKNSDIAARKLTSLGYTNVRLYKDGKAGWRAAGYSLVA
jgi:rhodanese-related sulfurtransferase